MKWKRFYILALCDKMLVNQNIFFIVLMKNVNLQEVIRFTLRLFISWCRKIMFYALQTFFSIFPYSIEKISNFVIECSKVISRSHIISSMSTQNELTRTQVMIFILQLWVVGGVKWFFYFSYSKYFGELWNLKKG